MSVIYSGKTSRKGRRKYNTIVGRKENQFISKSSHLGVPWTMLLISSHVLGRNLGRLKSGTKGYLSFVFSPIGRSKEDWVNDALQNICHLK